MFFGNHGMTQESNSGRRAGNESETSRLLPRVTEADGDGVSAFEAEQGGYRTAASGGPRRDTAANRVNPWDEE